MQIDSKYLALITIIDETVSDTTSTPFPNPITGFCTFLCQCVLSHKNYILGQQCETQLPPLWYPFRQNVINLWQLKTFVRKGENKTDLRLTAGEEGPLTLLRPLWKQAYTLWSSLHTPSHSSGEKVCSDLHRTNHIQKGNQQNEQ